MHREYTEDELGALRGIMPFSPNAVHEFTPEKYKIDTIPEDIRPVFSIEPFNNDEKEKVRGLMTIDTDSARSQLSEFSRKKIKGWRNVILLDKQEELLYETDDKENCKRAMYYNLPITMQAGVFTELCIISGLMDMEKMGL